MMQENPQIIAAKKANNPARVIQLNSGFVVMNNSQFLPGYCLLLAYPQVGALNDLTPEARAIFLTDMGVLGEAIEKVCQPKRMNYAILGNQDPFLHAHLIPRYEWEAEAFKPLSTWRYPEEIWTRSEHLFCAERHTELRDKIKRQLLALS
jgi:diadenosine tetraphosphate (Ap4A) HIT family hydrolase